MVEQRTQEWKKPRRKKGEGSDTNAPRDDDRNPGPRADEYVRRPLTRERENPEEQDDPRAPPAPARAR